MHGLISYMLNCSLISQYGGRFVTTLVDPGGYFARCCKNLAKEGYLARSCKMEVILQNVGYHARILHDNYPNISV